MGIMVCFMDKLIQTRSLAIAAIIMSTYNVYDAIRYRQPTAVIVCWSVFYVITILAGISVWIAISKNKPFLFFPIFCSMIFTLVLYSALLVLSMIALISPDSFYGQYLIDNHTDRGASDVSRSDEAYGYAITAVVTSAVMVGICIWGVVVNIRSYKAIRERAENHFFDAEQRSVEQDVKEYHHR